MELDTSIRLLTISGSASLGAYLAAVRGKMNSTKEKNKFHYIFYFFSGLVFFSALVACFVYYHELLQPNWFSIVVILVSLVFSALLALFTKKHLTGKTHFTTAELDPIINKFTEHADIQNIRLLAGDLNFFGNTPLEMDQNSQYVCLKKMAFRSIEILCFKPQNVMERIRYGKILQELNVVLKYYQPSQADLNIRGRLKTVNDVTHLLIYNKVKPKIYEALELDTADRHGALYDHTWKLIWRIAEAMHEEEINNYKSSYLNSTK